MQAQRDDSALPWLEILHGSTQFPQRRIRGERFLIGSAENCHLRLGGDMPPLCCVMHRDGDQLWIDSLLPEPELHVNGRSVDGAFLADGDVIRIGPFEMRVHLPSTVETVASERTAESALRVVEEQMTPDELADFADEDLGALSADEIIDRMKADLDLLDRYERGRRSGAAALWAAVAATDSDEAEPPDLPPDDDSNEAAGFRNDPPQQSTPPTSDRPPGPNGTIAHADADQTLLEFVHTAEEVSDELRQLAVLVLGTESSRDGSSPTGGSTPHAAAPLRVPQAMTVDGYVAGRLQSLADRLDRFRGNDPHRSGESRRVA